MLLIALNYKNISSLLTKNNYYTINAGRLGSALMNNNSDTCNGNKNSSKLIIIIIALYLFLFFSL